MGRFQRSSCGHTGFLVGREALAHRRCWEFVTTLDYEWSVIRGHRPYRWTIWIYSLTRISTLLAMIVNMIGFDSSRPINCQLWVNFEAIFAYTAAATASLLIVIRAIAVWNRNYIVSAIVLGIWVAYVGTLIHGVVLMHSVWSPLTNACDVLNSADSKLAIIIALSTDLVLLLIILIGLLRWRFKEGGPSSLTRFLWKQGLIWLLLATVAYVPAVLFLSLNLNPPFNLMFQTPALVTVTIAATRMYRSLSDYGSRDISVSLPKRSALSTAETNEIWVSPIPLGRMEVSVHTNSEQYPSPRRGHFDSFVVADGKMHDGPHGLGDVERGVEK
ncbi:hypothetical protein F5148DRAFT_248797 [Russula earlei]|uniref:Uncharacterized protein n=1 Tax=Russula earlei TaxID=71964 RepID=A0ACC0U3X3_9AGAM|nr:hypothetical protein F5148DRAFT_248797 [Russula earlei]